MDIEQAIRDTEMHEADVDALLARVTDLAGPGAAAIVAERIRQREVEGWTPAHDDEHTGCQLAVAAACYAVAGIDILVVDGELGEDAWPWNESWDKRAAHPPDRRAAIAGALLAAEWDRLARARAEGETGHA